MQNFIDWSFRTILGLVLILMTVLGIYGCQEKQESERKSIERTYIVEKNKIQPFKDFIMNTLNVRYGFECGYAVGSIHMCIKKVKDQSMYFASISGVNETQYDAFGVSHVEGEDGNYVIIAAYRISRSRLTGNKFIEFSESDFEIYSDFVDEVQPLFVDLSSSNKKPPKPFEQ